MIDAAERLAAEGGLAAMSLRAVQEAAGQRNKSAAQYHFGTRDGLVEAIAAARMGPINERRAAMLAELGPDAELEHLVRAFIAPLAEAVVGRGTYWARFLQLASNHPVLSEIITSAFEAASYRDVRDRIDAALVHLAPTTRDRRVDQMVALVLWVLGQAESEDADDFDLDDLVAVATAVLTAPSGAST